MNIGFVSRIVIKLPADLSLYYPEYYLFEMRDCNKTNPVGKLKIYLSVNKIR
jgi:hypothetical protein